LHPPWRDVSSPNTFVIRSIHPFIHFASNSWKSSQHLIQKRKKVVFASVHLSLVAQAVLRLSRLFPNISAPISPHLYISMRHFSILVQ
jgi:hypothetical protein